MQRKILFVDDDPLMHRLYQPHLERAGYQVIGLMDGGEALQVASREKPQVVVMDMMLPGTDGISAILVIKSAGATRHIPIIAISSDVSYNSMRQQMTDMGVEVFLSKPFSPARLVTEIRRLDPCPPTAGAGTDK